MNKLLINKLKDNYNIKELKGDIAKKYKAKYVYTDLEQYEKLYNNILENIKDIIDKDKFKEHLVIKGIEIEGITSRNKNILAIEFRLSEEKYFYILPIDDELKNFIYYDDMIVEFDQEEEILSYEKAIKKIRKYAKVVDCYGYFDEYDENEHLYLEALKKYDEYRIIDMFSVKNNELKLIDSDIILEKIDMDKIENKKLLSNIYCLKVSLLMKESVFLGVESKKTLEKYWDKSLEYNPKNINLLKCELDKPIESIIESAEEKYQNIEQLTREILETRIAISNLEYEFIEEYLDKFTLKKILKQVENNLKAKNLLYFKIELIKLYETLLKVLKNNNADEKYIKVSQEILDSLNENIELPLEDIIESSKNEDIDFQKDKTIADALYLSGNYREATRYYEKIILDMNIKNTEVRKEVYEKLINSYMKLNDCKKAKEIHKNAIEEFENEKIFKLLGKMLNK